MNKMETRCVNPRQGDELNREVEVDLGDRGKLEGKVVRHDMEWPYIKVIQLNNGEYVLSTEYKSRLKNWEEYNFIS
jgi:hypothetical protein